MILHVDDSKYLDSFSTIYNSSILLFKEEERGLATPETFSSQLENDINYIHISDDGDADAFLSYHDYGDNRYELTSLYVSREKQNKSIGYELLSYFENLLHQNHIIFVKVLNNAPWSMRFYCKYGYKTLDANEKEIAISLGLEEKPWSTILCKRIEVDENI